MAKVITRFLPEGEGMQVIVCVVPEEGDNERVKISSGYFARKLAIHLMEDLAEEELRKKMKEANADGQPD